MTLDIKKLSLLFLVPVVLLLAGQLFISGFGHLPWSLRAVLGYAPYLVIAVGIAAGLGFHSSRAVFSLLAILAGYWLVSRYFADGWRGGGPEARIAYAALSDLLPINLVFFAFIRERGVLTPAGLNRMAFIGLQVVLVAFLTGAGNWLEAGTAATLRQGMDALLHYRVFDPSFDAWTHLPQPSILLFILAFIILLVRLLVLRSPLDGGSLGALAASALALHMVGQGVASTVHFTVAALILLLGVIQDAYRMAFLDELTGLPGRRALTAAQKRLGGHYTAAMLDVDHFKSFNDTYGHDVGDQVLKMVAARMGDVTGGGKSFRYGGEEFTVLFQNKSKNDAALHLESLRHAIEGSSFRLRAKDRPEEKPGRKKKAHGAKMVGVTVSIGMAERQAKEAPDDVLKRADEALYRAKEGGRNRLAG